MGSTKRICTTKTTSKMGTFIEDYLQNPSQAISSALKQINKTNWSEQVDDDAIYAQLATGEFRLYEEIVLSQIPEISPTSENYVAVV